MDLWKTLRPVSLLLAFCGLASAELQRIEIRGREAVGAYEKIWGRAYFAADPKLPMNQAVADIDLAPKNAEGKVEFSGDFMVLRPKSPEKSRGTVFLEVVNRGISEALGILSGASIYSMGPDRWDLGDRFLLEQGFTVAFLGWQYDVPKGTGLTFEAPTVPVTGVVRQSHIGTGARGRHNAFRLSMCASDSQGTDAQVTFRSRIDEAPKVLPPQQWRFVRDGCTFSVNGGFHAGVYDVVYYAKKPPVAGLGLAAVRDFASYLKYGGKPGTLREDPASLRKVIGYGYSQSARFLRQFVRDGFNQDEKGRQAFDGLMISSAGAGGGSFNHRFAMPGEAGNSVLSILRPVDMPPFTDEELLAKAEAAHVTPRIFYTFTSTEYWARAGSLTHTTPDGKSDVPLEPGSRLYFLSGTAHAAGPFPPSRFSGMELHYGNFAQQRWVTRALVLDLDAWVSSGKEPPPSTYPTLATKELTAREAVQFPQSPTIEFPQFMPQVWRMDFGPDFLTKGIISIEPPVLGPPYTLLVPQVDANGNDVGGVALPEVAVPLGTFTGWNVHIPAMENLQYLSGLVGSFEPFPKTRAEREMSGDARLSISERYPSRQDYLDRVGAAADKLVRQRFLRAEDFPEVFQRAAEMWDFVAQGE